MVLYPNQTLTKIDRNVLDKAKELVKMDNVEFKTQQQAIEKAVLRLHRAYKEGYISQSI